MASTALQFVARWQGLAHTRTNKCTKNHKGPTTLCGTTPSLPAASREEKRFSPFKAPQNNHTPDPSVFSNCDQPNMFLITLSGPGDTGELSGQEGQATVTAHPGTMSTSREIRRPGRCKMPATSHHATFDAPAVYEQTHPQQNA